MKPNHYNYYIAMLYKDINMLPVVEVKEIKPEELSVKEIMALFIKGPFNLIDKELFEVEEITLTA